MRRTSLVWVVSLLSNAHDLIGNGTSRIPYFVPKQADVLFRDRRFIHRFKYLSTQKIN